MSTIPEYLLCSRFDVMSGTCLPSELGKFHIKSRIYDITNELLEWGNKTKTASIIEPANTPNSILASDIEKNALNVIYSVKETGYYCVFLASNELEGNKDYKVQLIVNNT